MLLGRITPLDNRRWRSRRPAPAGREVDLFVIEPGQPVSPQTAQRSTSPPACVDRTDHCTFGHPGVSSCAAHQVALPCRWSTWLIGHGLNQHTNAEQGGTARCGRPVLKGPAAMPYLSDPTARFTLWAVPLGPDAPPSPPRSTPKLNNAFYSAARPQGASGGGPKGRNELKFIVTPGVNATH